MSTYLYNGIKLPALPDWDTDTYPYVHIIKTNETDGVCYYGLYMHSRSDNYVVVGPKNSWEPSYITRIYHKHDKMFVRSSFCDTNTSWAEVEISESAVDETYEYTTTMTYYPPVIWTNHDLYYEDGTLYLAASDPIPVTPSTPFCLRSWLTGFALGLAGKSLPYSKVIREPVAYLYNGIRLPALPEWDRGVYPYAVLQWREEVAGLQSVETRLFVSTEPPYKGSIFYIIPVGSSGVMYRLNEENEWYAYASWTPNLDISGAFAVPHWSNYDMLKSDGTVYLAASKPVPVYE